jgi:glycosyltransferase involved in cell wall biosynthesis
MDYPPNVTAIIYFCRKIWPSVRTEVPAAELKIVGRKPTPEVKALEQTCDGVEVTGEVEDMRSLFESAQVYVCPLKSGSGIKIKILESWAMEVPVVATSLSCEGIEVSPGEDIIVADKPKEFALAVIRLLRNEDLRKNLAKNGRQKVVEKYGIDVQAAKVEQVFQQLIEQQQRKPNSD